MEIKLNNNSRVQFNEEKHEYWLDGVTQLSGVTSGVMDKYNLRPDYSNVKAATLNNKALYGSKVHKDIENYCNGSLGVVMTPELSAFIKCGIKWVANEYLVSDNECVASCIDIVADAGNGKVDLIDVKTTSTLHHEPLSWQLSIYAYLFNLQNPDIEVNKLYGLHIKDGKAAMVEVPKIDSDEIRCLIECYKYDLPFTPSKTELPAETTAMLAEMEQVSNKIALVKATLKELEEIDKSIKEKLLQEMEYKALKTLESGPLKVTYVAPYTKEAVDTKKLREAVPEIYEKYKKVSNIGASLKITIKN
jgi:hypothetical protein